MATQTKVFKYANENISVIQKNDKHVETIKINNNKKQIKRPMNAFMLWSKQKRREISRQDPSLHNAQISKLLGEEWKMLSSTDKLPYVEESQKLMLKHKEEHPEYRYKPRQNKMTKNIIKQDFSSYTPSLVAHSRKRFTDYPSRFLPYERSSVKYMSNICKIPGCYECHVSSYERAYEKAYFERHMYDAPCPCCRPMSLSPPCDVSKRSSSFSVKDIMRSDYKSYSRSTSTSTGTGTSEDGDVTRYNKKNY